MEVIISLFLLVLSFLLIRYGFKINKIIGVVLFVAAVAIIIRQVYFNVLE